MDLEMWIRSIVFVFCFFSPIILLFVMLWNETFESYDRVTVRPEPEYYSAFEEESRRLKLITPYVDLDMVPAGLYK